MQVFKNWSFHLEELNSIRLKILFYHVAEQVKLNKFKHKSFFEQGISDTIMVKLYGGESLWQKAILNCHICLFKNDSKPSHLPDSSEPFPP